MSGLQCSDCPTACALRRQITDLRAEIEEWERARREEPAPFDLELAVLLLERIGFKKIGPARLLAALVASPGRICRIDELLEIASRGGHLMQTNMVRVYVSLARRALREKGVDAAIENVWGYGYRMSADAAQAVRAALDREAAA